MTWDRDKSRGAKYGKGWAKTRVAWAAVHAPTDPCTRCRRELGPMGSWLHLDHNDWTGEVDGFAHGPCNVRAGATLGRARQKQARQPPTQRAPRDWT